MKPIGSAQGKGIVLFSRLSEIAEWRTDFRQTGRADKDKDGGDRAKSEVEAYIVQVRAAVRVHTRNIVTPRVIALVALHFKPIPHWWEKV